MARHSKNGQTESTTSLKLTNEEKNCLTILSKHKHIYDLYEKTEQIVNFHHEIQNELLEAYRLIDPHYGYNRSCPVCVVEFIVTIYRWYKSRI